MKLIVQGCGHPKAVTITPYLVTCTKCLRRLTLDEQTLTFVQAPAPTGTCVHARKKTLVRTERQSVLRVVCLDCGCVLQHPDGPGAWSYAYDYRFVIKEEDIPTWPQLRSLFSGS